MTRAQLNQFKTILEKERADLARQLSQFAKPDPKLKSDWDTIFPPPSSGVGDQQLEEEADRVENYEAMLPVEHSLEMRLKETQAALARLAKGTFGKCRECGKSISLARLRANPAAGTCSRCK